MKNRLIFLIFLLIPSISMAIMPPPPGKWKCRAYDAEQRMWSKLGSSRADALKRAYNACRNDARDPGTCRAAPTYCEYARLSQYEPHNHVCRVRDGTGHVWRWKGGEACRHALHECRRWHHQHGDIASGRGGVCFVIH